MAGSDDLDVAPFIREFSSGSRRLGESNPTKTEFIDNLDVAPFVRGSTTNDVSRSSDNYDTLIWRAVGQGISSSQLDRLAVSSKVVSIAPHSFNSALAVWSGKFSLAPVGLILAGALAAKNEGGSEDSCPLVILRSRGDGNVSLLGAVSDGVGGAGSSTTTVNEGGLLTERTQAFVASRLVRRTLAEQFLAGRSLDAQTVHSSISQSLEEYKSRYLDEDPVALRGSMIKTLPATLASFHCLIDRSNRGGFVRLSTTWAGDSRIYVMSPISGLAQATRDDVGVEDTFEQLMCDPPTTNVLNASGPFDVNRSSIQIDTPFLAIAATDGLFGYLPTPGALELLLIQELQAARDVDDFARSLAIRVSRMTADDASYVVAMIGFGERINSVAHQFSKRYQVLEERYGGRSPEELLNVDETERERLWVIEKASYSRFLMAK